MIPAETLSIEQKIKSGGFLKLRREFCPWVGICAGTAYKEVTAGRLRLTKVGNKTFVIAADAIEFRERLRKESRGEAA